MTITRRRRRRPNTDHYTVKDGQLRPNPKAPHRPVVLRYEHRGPCFSSWHIGNPYPCTLLYLEGDRGHLMCRKCVAKAVKSARIHFVHVLVKVNREYDPDDTGQATALLERIRQRFNLAAAGAAKTLRDAREYWGERGL